MESSDVKKELCIIYHCPCYDGAYGAINAYLYYKNFTNDKYKITFLPLKNTFPIYSKLEKKYNKIISLDLGLRDDDIKFLTDENNNNTSIIIFDHHCSWSEKYNKEYFPKIKDRKKLTICYDEQNKKSACGLSFDYFKNKALSKKNLDKNKVEEIYSDNLKLINLYVEDSDTGNCNMKNNEEFKSALSQSHSIHLTDLTFKTLQRINDFINITPSYLIKIGYKCITKIKKQSRNVLKENKIYIVELQKCYKFLMCITEKKYVRNFACPLLGKISQKKGFLPVGAFVFTFERENKLYKFSMRSADDSFDVSKIASIYGGGGHKHAAAFTMNYDEIKKFIVGTINIYDDIDKTSF